MQNALTSHLDSAVACVQFLLQPWGAERGKDLYGLNESTISLLPKSDADLLLKTTSKFV